MSHVRMNHFQNYENLQKRAETWLYVKVVVWCLKNILEVYQGHVEEIIKKKFNPITYGRALGDLTLLHNVGKMAARLDIERLVPDVCLKHDDNIEQEASYYFTTLVKSIPGISENDVSESKIDFIYDIARNKYEEVIICISHLFRLPISLLNE